MKKVFFKTMMVAALAGTAMSSCVNEIEDLYDSSYAAKKKQQYENQWKIQFGAIDPEHNWGFSSDASEAKAMTRGWANTEANTWGSYVEVPDTLTGAQKELVTDWFEANQNPQGISVNWSDFFAQQVSSNGYGKTSMSYLTVGEEDAHMNNFNGGDCGLNGQVWGGELKDPTDQNSKIYHADRIQFMQSTSTARFGYKCTLEDNATMYYDNYVIVPGENIDASLAGMFFLGYDFESNGSTAEKQIAADGYYSDWIIKITPAIYKNAKRIICEDLGNIGDFDFNDIVFDASFQGGDVVITVRAAGGTLPIYIGDVEIHEAMGVASNVMVNTGAANGTSAPAAIFRVSAPTSYNYADIQVKVNNAVVLEAPQGDAPQKICVPTTFKWCTERTNIKDAYPGFVNWSQDQSQSTDWYNSPEEGSVM